MRVCLLRHLSLNTEKTYTNWLDHYGSFPKDPKLKTLTPEQKNETFLTRLAIAEGYIHGMPLCSG